MWDTCLRVTSLRVDPTACVEDSSIWPWRKAVLKEGSLVLDASACHIHELRGLRGSQGMSCDKEMLVLEAGAAQHAPEMKKARGIWTVCPSAFPGTWYDYFGFLFITKNKIWNRNENIQQISMFQLCRIEIYVICYISYVFMKKPSCTAELLFVTFSAPFPPISQYLNCRHEFDENTYLWIFIKWLPKKQL